MGVEIKESRLLSKRFHPSWFIAALSASLIVGTFLSLYFSGFFGVEWLIVSICLAVVGFARNGYIGLLLVILSGIFLGLWRGGDLLNKQKEIENLIGETVVVSGIVTEDPTYDIDGDLRFRLKDLVFEDDEKSGELWASTDQRVEIKRSDVVSVEGQLSEGFGTIAVSMYHAEVLQIVRPDFADIARDARDSFANGIREGIQEPEASLGAGFLLGQKTALPEKLDSELRLLGLTHIVVASGYNLTILIRFARRLFVKISRFTALAFSGGLVYCFALVTGWSPSMTRAGLIAGISLLAWYYGRKLHPIVLLSFSAGITVLINPTYAWGDIGWLLSFTSFIGVIILGPLLNAYFWGDKKPGAIRQVLIETLSAQILTLPIIAYVFGQYSPLALPANLLILPLIPLAMLLTFIAGIAGLLVAPIAFIVGWPAETLMRYMVWVVDKLAQSPLAIAETSFGITAVVVFYMLIVSAIVFLKRRTEYPFREYNVIE